MHSLRMHKGIVIGLGVALATFAVSVTEADASCNRGRRACRCAPQPAYSFGPPPPSRFIPPNPVYGHYGHRSPRGYANYGPSGVGYYYPPAAYGPSQPYVNGASYYGPPRPEYGSFPGRSGRIVRSEEDLYAPPYHGGYRPTGVWSWAR